MLLECQFDQNDKLKSSVNKGFEAEDLRMLPIGRDLDGFIYWYHEDDSNGVRLYTTEEDEVNCESWRLLAGETEELATVVEFIESKSEVNPKEIALARREEMKKKTKTKNSGKKKGKKGKKKESSEDDEDYDDDNPCARCFSNVRPESILLCDKCDAAYHTACLRPPLLTVPQGDWFCPFCQQLVLLGNLKEKKTRLAARMKLRQRRAKRLGFAGIDLNNILQKASDDEEDQSIRRSGRSRKNVDYTFKEFEEDITSAVENDKKRFKTGEVNGEEKGMLYSKPAYETGGLLDTARRNTRRSRRLMDLDFESDSESRTSGYEVEGNSDDEAQSEFGQQTSNLQGKLRRSRRVIDDDDDEEDGNGACDDGRKSCDAGETSCLKTVGGEKDEGEKKENAKSQEPCDTKKTSGEENMERGDEAAGKPFVSEAKTESERKRDKDEKIASTRRETLVDATATVMTSQRQNTTSAGNRIQPHSRIASVAPVARSPPTPSMNNFRSPLGYVPEGVFPNPPNYETLKPQFPVKQGLGQLGSSFVGVSVAGTNIAGNNFSGSANFSPKNAPGMLHEGPTFQGSQGMGTQNRRTSFGEATRSGLGQGGQNTSAPNLERSFSGVTNEVGAGVTSFGASTNFGAQDMPGSFWGGQNELNSVYNYQRFGQSSGTMQAPVTGPANKQTVPPAYSSGSQFGGFSQQFQATSNVQNFMASQQSGNFTNPSHYFPTMLQQPPPPYAASNSLNADARMSSNQGNSNIIGNQWTYPEGYGYYNGQGNTAGQSF